MDPWPPAPEAIAIAPGEVLLLLLELDVPAERRAALRESFSAREAERAESFAHDEHRFRWSVGRGLLREALGRAAGCPAREVVFGYGGHGKPTLANDPSLRFNLSHSGGLALLALSRSGEVGVDVELPRARRTDDLARRYFAPGEQQRLFSIVDPAVRADAFFRLWTCKEAFLKATGEGLSRSLRSYEIEADGLDGSAAPWTVPPLRVLWAKGEDAARWSVHPVEPGGPYRAALVAEGQGLRLRRYRLAAG